MKSMKKPPGVERLLPGRWPGKIGGDRHDHDLKLERAATGSRRSERACDARLGRIWMPRSNCATERRRAPDEDHEIQCKSLERKRAVRPSPRNCVCY